MRKRIYGLILALLLCIPFYAQSSGIINIGAVLSGGNIFAGDQVINGDVTVDSNAANTTSIITLENTAGDISVFRVDATPEGSITASRGDVAIGINGGNEGALWIKHQGDATNTGWEKMSVSHYTDFHLHDNSTPVTINTANIPHLIQGLFGEEVSSGFTFAAGSTGAITAFADAGSGQVTVTSAGHTLSNGDIASISGTTSYNGIFIIAGVAGNNFEITDTWVADDATGIFYQGDSVTADSGSAGLYKIEFHGFGLPSSGTNQDYEFEIYKNITPQENAESQRRFSNSSDVGTFAGGGIVTIADGDILTFAIIGLTGTQNFLAKHLNVVIHSL